MIKTKSYKQQLRKIQSFPSSPHGILYVLSLWIVTVSIGLIHYVLLLRFHTRVCCLFVGWHLNLLWIIHTAPRLTCKLYLTLSNIFPFLGPYFCYRRSGEKWLKYHVDHSWMISHPQKTIEVVCLVLWLLNGSEAEDDLVLLQTFLLPMCNHVILMLKSQ